MIAAGPAFLRAAAESRIVDSVERGDVGQKPKLVVALLDEGQEFQRLQAEDARARAAESGVTVDVVFAENSAIYQIQQLYKVIQVPAEQRPHAILVETVAGGGLERVARAAVRAGIGWVLMNRKVPYIVGLRDENPGVPIMTVSTDQLEIGRIQGQQVRALAPGGSRDVVYVQGPSDTSAAQERLQGAREALEGSGIDLKVVDGQWTEGSGEQALERWLRLKRFEKETHIDVVSCQNDAMAVGARRALAAVAPELARIPFTGVDGLEDARLVRKGELTATVIVPSNTGPAVRHVAEALRHGTALPGQLLLAPVSFPEIATLARIR
jgi:ABC-type sugar transport system substrate-binding protein